MRLTGNGRTGTRRMDGAGGDFGTPKKTTTATKTGERTDARRGRTRESVWVEVCVREERRGAGLAAHSCHHPTELLWRATYVERWRMENGERNGKRRELMQTTTAQLEGRYLPKADKRECPESDGRRERRRTAEGAMGGVVNGRNWTSGC